MWKLILTIVPFFVEILSYFFGRFKKKKAAEERADQLAAENVAKQRSVVAERVGETAGQLDDLRKEWDRTLEKDLKAVQGTQGGGPSQ